MTAPVPYADFRTGYTFADVYHMVYGRKWKRRRGVLGYWRELKQAMYAEYLRAFDPAAPVTHPPTRPRSRSSRCSSPPRFPPGISSPGWS